MGEVELCVREARIRPGAMCVAEGRKAPGEVDWVDFCFFRDFVGHSRGEVAN